MNVCAGRGRQPGRLAAPALNERRRHGNPRLLHAAVAVLNPDAGFRGDAGGAGRGGRHGNARAGRPAAATPPAPPETEGGGPGAVCPRSMEEPGAGRPCKAAGVLHGLCGWLKHGCPGVFLLGSMGQERLKARSCFFSKSLTLL